MIGIEKWFEWKLFWRIQGCMQMFIATLLLIDSNLILAYILWMIGIAFFGISACKKGK